MIRSSIYSVLLLLTLTLPLSAQDARIDSLTQALSQVMADSDKVLTFSRLADAYRIANDVAKSIEVADEGLLFVIEADYDFGHGLLLTAKARALALDQKYSESNEYHQEAITYYEKENRFQNIFVTYRRMAINMANISHHSESLQFNTKALLLAEQNNDPNRIRTAAAAIARDYERLQDPDNELKFQLKAIDQCDLDTFCNDAAKGTLYNNIGSAYKNLSLYEEAVSWLHRSIAINNAINNERTLLYNYATLAEVYVLTRQLDSAEYYIRRELADAKRLNAHFEETFGFQVLGDVHYHRGQYEDAIKNLKIAYDRCREAGSTYDDILVFVLKNIYKAYQKKGDYQQAFYYLEEHLNFQERIYSDRAEKIAQLQLYYDNEQKKAQIAVLKKQDELREGELQRRKIIDWILIASVIAGLVFAFFMYRLFRNKQKTNKQLQEKSKEIQERSRLIVEQKELIEQALNKVKLLGEIGQEVTAHLSISKIIETTYQSVNKLMSAEGFGIGIYNEAENRIDFPGFIEKGITYPTSYDMLDNDNRLSIWCFKNQEEVVINNMADDYQKYIKRRLAPNIGEAPESILYFPLINKDKKIGVITVQSFTQNAYNRYDCDILRSMATYVAIALDNAENFKKLRLASKEMEKQKELIEERGLALSQQFEKTEEAYENMKLLGKVGQSIISNLSVEKIVSTVYRSVNDLMDAEVFWIGLYNKETEMIEFEGAIENGQVLPPFAIDVKDKNRLAVYTHETQEEVLINDFIRDYSRYIKMIKPAVAGEQPASIIYIPLKGKDGRIGVITVQSFRKYAYTEYHVNVLQNLATYTTIALENALLYQNLENKVKERTAELAAQKDRIEEAFNNIKLLSEIGQQLTGLLSMDKLINTLYDNVNNLMDATAFGVGIYQENLQQIAFVGAIEGGKELPVFYHELDDSKYYSAWCIKRNQEVFTNNAMTEYVNYVPDMQPPKYGEYPNSIIYLPLITKAKAIGVLTVQSYEKDAYTENHINILRNLAAYAAIALDNAGAYEQIEDKNKEIQQSNKKILSSMNYAKRIQNAILPHRSTIENAVGDAFVLFKPKDIVSGDFFWFSQKGEKLFIAAVDCTGHGVPGAFMSMIGNNLLSEIVNDLNIESPDMILNELHSRVRSSLRQKETENRDGMDMALCVIDKEKQVLEFAGAKNPLVYIQEDENGEPQMHTIRGDKMPIGGLQREQQRIFTKHTIKLQQNAKLLVGEDGELINESSSEYKPTSFYIFSDGYQDQFGGRKSRKFMLKNFKRLLYRIHDQPMAQQRDTMKEIIEMWMEGEQQTDDILVIGFKI
ncbi:MAG: GAF domain-containing protein [Flammeovirgaceae bacterium]